MDSVRQQFAATNNQIAEVASTIQASFQQFQTALLSKLGADGDGDRRPSASGRDNTFLNSRDRNNSTFNHTPSPSSFDNVPYLSSGGGYSSMGGSPIIINNGGRL